MNRRDLFKGLAAAMVVASVPFPIEAIETLPDTQVVAYLRRLKIDLLNKIIYPPVTMDKDGTMEMMKTDVWEEALRHVNKLLEELA